VAWLDNEFRRRPPAWCGDPGQRVVRTSVNISVHVPGADVDAVGPGHHAVNRVGKIDDATVVAPPGIVAPENKDFCI